MLEIWVGRATQGGRENGRGAASTLVRAPLPKAKLALGDYLATYPNRRNHEGATRRGSHNWRRSKT